MEEDLGQLQSVFGTHLPKGALGATSKGANSRHRLFNTEVTFWAFLFPILSPQGAYREAVRKVQAWWHGRGKAGMSAHSAAYCKARAPLLLATLEKLLLTVASTLERRILQCEHWLGGRRRKILDGTTLSMPDTPAKQKRWPQPSRQKPGCGFPLLRTVGLFCLSRGALLRYSLGNKHNQENHLIRQLLDGLAKGDVLLADGGFCSFGLIAVLLARGVDCVMCLHQARRCDLRQGRRLGENDRSLRRSHPCRHWQAAMPAAALR
jgi:hypothetical protein